MTGSKKRKDRLVVNDCFLKEKKELNYLLVFFWRSSFRPNISFCFIQIPE